MPPPVLTSTEGLNPEVITHIFNARFPGLADQSFHGILLEIINISKVIACCFHKKYEFVTRIDYMYTQICHFYASVIYRLTFNSFYMTYY